MSSFKPSNYLDQICAQGLVTQLFPQEFPHSQMELATVWTV